MTPMTYTDPHDPRWEPLLAAAWAARSRAYAPYSGFQVGAALRLRDGRIQAGCNVENASYGGAICAERGALCAAVTDGLRPEGLEALVVVTEAADLTPPCGFCRQVLAEFAEDLPVLLANRSGRALHRLKDLLPHAFTGRNLS